VLVAALLAGCFSPRPEAGAPCGPGSACPTGLVCSPASVTCELVAVDAAVPDDPSVVDMPPPPAGRMELDVGAHTFVVPAGVVSLHVKLWAGGGGGGGGNEGQPGDAAGVGGGAGYGEATLAVTPGDTLAVVVGAGGGAGRNENTAINVLSPGGAGGVPGGGDGGDVMPNGWIGPSGGGGGGLSAISSGMQPLIVVGGGGGGAGDSSDIGVPRGGVGGATGGTGGGAITASNGGRGGTATAGGAGGAGTIDGVAGASLRGADAPASQGNGRGAGGGGGGGLFGGGSGSSGNSSDTSGGGGGGSSFCVVPAMLISGIARQAGNAADPDAMGAGTGGTRTTAGTGGRAVLTW